ncbi:MAG: hypothetical protein KJ955_03980 [Nanoarchaeota archaeon]|nr:hypothetical protein [Nanoarchaeota archaeon]
MRTAGKVGLGIAAAFGFMYAGYATKTNSNDSPQNQPLEETVCEEVDTQAIYGKGRSEGYLSGLRAGRSEGGVIGEREGREAGFEQGKQYGLNACDERRYNEGLEEGKQRGYEEGLTKGEQLGLEEGEGKSRLLGSGTLFISEPGEQYFVTRRQNSEGGTTSMGVEIEGGCIKRYLYIGRPEDSIFLETRCMYGEELVYIIELRHGYKVDRLGDSIDDARSIPNPLKYGVNLLQRSIDFQENQELFLWADQKMREEIQRFSQPVEDIF